MAEGRQQRKGVDCVAPMDRTSTRQRHGRERSSNKRIGNAWSQGTASEQSRSSFSVPRSVTWEYPFIMDPTVYLLGDNKLVVDSAIDSSIIPQATLSKRNVALLYYDRVQEAAAGGLFFFEWIEVPDISADIY